METQRLGSERELRKVLRYLRDGCLLKITRGRKGLALLVKEGEQLAISTAPFDVADFLRESGTLELVEEGWGTQLFRLCPEFKSGDQHLPMIQREGITTYQVPPRLGLEQLRLFVRRREHSNPMLDSVSQLLERISVGASLSEIEELIRRDVHLAIRIIRVAGAPGFGARKIHSIRHAIELLGYDQLQSIVSTITLFSASNKRMLGPGLNRERFQRRSLLIALLNRTLASRLDLPGAETHFMAGLLQDCGYLPIAKLIPDKLEQVVAVLSRTEVQDVLELEQYYMGFTHVEAGRAFGEEYFFCEPVLEAISHHHCPMFAKDGFQVYADLGHLSNWIADQLGFTAFEGCKPYELDKYAAQRLNVSPAGLESTFHSVRQTADEAYVAISSQ